MNDYQIDKFSSIKNKLLFKIILASTIITFFATLVNFYVDYRNEKEVQNQVLDQIEKSTLVSLSKAVWYLDDTQVEGNLDGLIEMHDIFKLVVYDNTGQIIYKQEKKVIQRASKFSFVRSYPLIYNEEEDETLGTFEIRISNYFVYKRLAKQVFVFAVTQGIKTIIISIVMLFIFNYYVIRHLNGMASHLSSQSRNVHETLEAFDLNRKKLPDTIDEFDVLTESYNELVLVINQVHKDKKKQLAQKEKEYGKVRMDLEEYEILLKSIIKNNPTAIFCKDYRSGQGAYVEWNKAAEELWGLKEDEVIGKTDYDFFSQMQADLTHKNDLEILKNQELIFIDQESVETTQKKHLELQTWKVPVNDRNDIPRYLLVISVDITAEVESERKLIEAKNYAETALTAKSQFLATMSHEIRTPMNAVLSCTNLLLDNVRNTENQKLLRTIQSSGETLLALINDILDFSKLESGKMELETQPFCLAESVIQVIDLLSPEASEHSANLNWKIEDSVPAWVKGDETRFKQILTNIVGNAVKFTKDSIDVRVVSKTVSSNHEIQVSVKDNGIGIPKEAKLRLFKDFSQGDTSTTRKYGGTGLGLAISKKLTEAMGGEIWVESCLNHGATFHFTIILEEAEKGESKKKLEISDFNPNMAIEHPLKILMAEDNTVNQMVAKKLLKKLGYRMDVVTNGFEAVDAVMNCQYDIVLMDQHMPEMDGVEATIEIRKKLGDDKIPRIYALTASAFKEDRDRCLNAGMDGFLTKPINLSDIVLSLNECGQNRDLKKTTDLPEQRSEIS